MSVALRNALPKLKSGALWKPTLLLLALVTFLFEWRSFADLLRLIPGYFLVLLLPGLALQYFLREYHSPHLWRALATAFPYSVMLVAIPFIFAFGFHRGYGFFVGVYLFQVATLFCALIYREIRKPHAWPSLQKVFSEYPFANFMIPAVLFFGLAAMRIGMNQHAASDAIGDILIMRKTMAADLLPPPYYYLDRIQYGPGIYAYNLWYFAQMLVATFTKVDLIALYVYLPLFLVPLAIFSFYSFFHSLFQNQTVALSSTGAFILYHAFYRSWNWHYIAISSVTAEIFFALSLGYAVEYLHHARRGDLLRAVLIGSLAVWVHLGMALNLCFAWLPFSLIVIMIPSYRKEMAGRAVLILAGIAIFFLLYKGYTFMDYQRMLEVSREFRPNLDKFRNVGPGWLILDPVYVYHGMFGQWDWLVLLSSLYAVYSLIRDRSLSLIFLGSLIFFVPLLLFNPLSIDLLLRILMPGKVAKFIPLLILFASIPVLGWMIFQESREIVKNQSLGRRMLAGALIVFPIFLSFQRGGIDFVRHLYHGKHKFFLMSSPPIYKSLKEILPDRTVLLSPSLKMGAFMNVDTPLVKDHTELVSMMNPEVGLDDTLRQMKHYGVKYILEYRLLKGKKEGKAKWGYYLKTGYYEDLVYENSKFEKYPEHFQIILSEGQWTLYKVK